MPPFNPCYVLIVCYRWTVLVWVMQMITSRWEMRDLHKSDLQISTPPRHVVLELLYAAASVTAVWKVRSTENQQDFQSAHVETTKGAEDKAEEKTAWPCSNLCVSHWTKRDYCLAPYASLNVYVSLAIWTLEHVALESAHLAQSETQTRHHLPT